MPTYTTVGVENIVRDWCQSITSVPFYFLDVSLTRPSGLYGMIKLLNDSGVGTPVETYTDQTVSGDPWSLHELDTQKLVTFSVNAYRTGARDVLTTLANSKWLSLNYEILTNANIELRKISERRDLSQIVEGAWEERAQFDMTFNVIGVATELLNTIDDAPVSGDFNDN